LEREEIERQKQEEKRL